MGITGLKGQTGNMAYYNEKSNIHFIQAITGASKIYMEKTKELPGICLLSRIKTRNYRLYPKHKYSMFWLTYWHRVLGITDLNTTVQLDLTKKDQDIFGLSSIEISVRFASFVQSGHYQVFGLGAVHDNSDHNRYLTEYIRSWNGKVNSDLEYKGN